jgi:hypothetical protein
MVLEVLGFAAQTLRTTWIPSVAEGPIVGNFEGGRKCQILKTF